MPPNKKPDRVRRHTDDVVDLRLVKGDGIDPGDPDPEWSPHTMQWWSEFWGQRELLLALGSIDVHLVRRLASLIDLRSLAYGEVRRAPMVSGSKGQPVANPMSRQMLQYDAEIRQLEDRLGLSPRARTNLGFKFGQARKSLEDTFAPAASDGPKVLEVE